jgi:hypothetical protein
MPFAPCEMVFENDSQSTVLWVAHRCIARPSRRATATLDVDKTVPYATRN